MFTSNFATAGANPNAVCISRGAPPFYKGPKYMPLAPSWELLKSAKTLGPEEWDSLYEQSVLGRLSAEKVAADLGENAVMLCWEKAGEWCHRVLVARWLERECGILVPEYEKPAAPVTVPLFSGTEG